MFLSGNVKWIYSPKNPECPCTCKLTEPWYRSIWQIVNCQIIWQTVHEREGFPLRSGHGCEKTERNDLTFERKVIDCVWSQNEFHVYIPMSVFIPGSVLLECIIVNVCYSIPAPFISSRPENVVNGSGAYMAMLCEATGHPIPYLLWLFTRADGTTLNLPGTGHPNSHFSSFFFRRCKTHVI